MAEVAKPCSWPMFFLRLGWALVLFVTFPLLLAGWMVHQVYMVLRYGLSSPWPGEE